MLMGGHLVMIGHFGVAGANAVGGGGGRPPVRQQSFSYSSQVSNSSQQRQRPNIMI